MVPETLLVGLDEVSAVLLPVLNYALISQLLGLRTCTARLQLLLLTERVCMREREIVHTSLHPNCVHVNVAVNHILKIDG